MSEFVLKKARPRLSHSVLIESRVLEPIPVSAPPVSSLWLNLTASSRPKSLIVNDYHELRLANELQSLTENWCPRSKYLKRTLTKFILDSVRWDRHERPTEFAFLNSSIIRAGTVHSDGSNFRFIFPILSSHFSLEFQVLQYAMFISISASYEGARE